MSFNSRWMVSVGAAVLLSGGAALAADTDNAPTTTTQQQIGEGAPRSLNEGPRETVDERPAPPAPVVGTRTGVIEQAGAGSAVAYGRAGVLELGGGAGFSASSDYTTLRIEPSIGYFFVDNMELSLLPSLNYTNVSGGSDYTQWKVLLEPSFHLPFSDMLFGFIGVGAGVSHVSSQTGFAVQPRIGANILVGRSGILTPSFNVAYSTVDVVRVNTGTVEGTLLAVRTQYSLNIGYTVMW